MRVKLDKVCKRIYAGGDVPKDRYSTVKTAECAIPIYANAEKDNGLYGYTDTARENELSITVAARGTIGFTAIRREPFLPVVRLITVVPDLSTVSERYLYYALRNCKPASSGTSIPQLTVPDIKKNEIELYSLSVQETIADKLDAVGRVIELRQQQLQTLDELVKARFIELFGDPVLNQHGWRKVALEVNATLLNGRAYKQDELLDSGKYPVLRVGNFFSNRGWYYSDLELDDDKYCDNGDLLYAWSASFGPQIWNGGKVIYHYHIWKVLVGEAYNRQFLCKLLEYATESLMGDTHGIAMMHLTKSGMEKTEFIRCPICGNKTRDKVREDTILKNFPLFCPKCKSECLIDVEQFHISVIKAPDAQPQSR